ncbi:MAG TPA: hypothetical protein VEZ42_19015 [Pseudonocardia sp.]|nr:hypothetical protein [Pseudonocardia sp.]
MPLAQAGETPSPPPPSNSTSYKSNPDEFSLTVTPTRLIVGPDDIARTAESKVINTGQAAVPVIVQKRNFTAGTDGSLSYQDDAPYGAADWLTVRPESFLLAPGATQVVTSDIVVPPSPELGDHQVALVFLVPAGETDANIKVNRGVATPVFITVPGPTDNSVSIGALSAPGFALRGPVDISAELRSTGTVHHDFRAAAPLTVTSAGNATTFPDFTVMRGATRNVSTAWEPPLMCICNPTVTYLDDAGVPQTATATVVVFPADLFAGLVLLAVAIAFAIRWRRRRYQAAVRRAAESIRWGPPPAAGSHA